MVKKLFLVSMIALTGFAFNCNQIEAKNSDGDIVTINKDSDKAPDFALKSVDGKIVKLSDYKGKIIIIDFWATWCPPCRRGIPDLVEIQKEYKKDLVVIGISLDAAKTIKDVPGFIKEYGINYPIVYGDQQVTIDYGGIRSIPTSFVIDQKGNVVDSNVGLVSKETFVNKIKELLKKK